MASLVRLSKITTIPLVYLVEEEEGLANISCYSTILHGVGVWKQQVLELDLATRKLVRRTELVTTLHALGLVVHVWTLRNTDTTYMAAEFEQVSHCHMEMCQDPYMELAALDMMGVDGLFTDNTPTATRYLAVRHLLPGTCSLHLHLAYVAPGARCQCNGYLHHGKGECGERSDRCNGPW